MGVGLGSVDPRLSVLVERRKETGGSVGEMSMEGPVGGPCRGADLRLSVRDGGADGGAKGVATRGQNVKGVGAEDGDHVGGAVPAEDRGLSGDGGDDGTQHRGGRGDVENVADDGVGRLTDGSLGGGEELVEGGEKGVCKGIKLGAHHGGQRSEGGAGRLGDFGPEVPQLGVESRAERHERFAEGGEL